MSHRIRSVSVVGGFLDGLKLELAPGLNCFIGGRGTGKTTIIELIRFAFDAFSTRGRYPEEHRRIESLIQQNLGGGRVQVEFQTKNGLTYTVSRSWGEDPVVRTSDGLATSLSLKSGGVFAADIYSQNEVERIADRSPSQLVLIDRFETEKIAVIDAKLREVDAELRANANELLGLEAKCAELQEEVATLPEVEDKLKEYVGEGGDDADEIDEAHAQKSLRDRESQAIADIDAELSEYEQRVNADIGLLHGLVENHITEDLLLGPNTAQLAAFAHEVDECNEEANALLQRLGEIVARALRGVQTVQAALADAHEAQERAFRDLIEQHHVAMEQANERTQLERHRTVLVMKRRAAEQFGNEISDRRRKREMLLQKLSEFRDQRFSVRERVVDHINSKLEPTIRIRLEQFGEVGRYQSLVAESLKGIGIHQGVVAQKIAESMPPKDLVDAVRKRNDKGLIEQAALNRSQAEKVVEALSDRGVLCELEIVDMNDRPKIELLDVDVYKDSLTLSTGQKCTSILPILLLDSDRPLLVDQPEDNLDNRFIFDTIVSRIHEVKDSRQLIFVTHNPNIPVLGDASKVFVFASSGSKGRIECEGTVDDCREAIVSLLEGGEEAFRRRQEKYQY
ncbi:MAG: AAA family ATPase [Planctomycetaceae bacterium]